MAQTVVLQTECLHVKKGGIDLHVTKDGKTIGTLKVSNGAIEWCPRNKKQGIKLNWTKFDDIMKSNTKEDK